MKEYMRVHQEVPAKKHHLANTMRVVMATGIITFSSKGVQSFDEFIAPEPTPISTGMPMPPAGTPTLVFEKQCPAILCTPLSADVNGDRVVDPRDLQLVADCLDQPATQCPGADVTRDGVIDVADMACVASNLSAHHPTPEAIGQDTNFVFGEGVSLQEQQEIASDMGMVRDWMSAKTRIEINDLHVFASGNAVWVIDQYLGRTIFPQQRDETQRRLANATAFVGEIRDIFIITSSAGWTRASPIICGPVPEGRIHTLLHENFHTIQREVGGYNGIFPHWLNEGGAHYVAAIGLNDNGIYPYKKIRRGHVSEAASVKEDLRSMESAQGFYGAGSPFADEYSLASLATELLVKDLPDNGIPALISFWQHIGERSPWQVAFQLSFGKTPDQFYSEFEKWRKGSFQ